MTISKKPDTSGLAFVYVNGEEVPRKDDNTYEVYVAVTSTEAEVLVIASVNISIVQIGTNQSEIGRSTVKVSTLDLVNTYTITVTDSDDAEKTEAYTLIFKKPLTDNTLKEITISNEEMSVTATKVAGTNKYTAKINEKYENLKVTATANYDLAQVAIETNTYKDKQDTYDIVFNQETCTLTIKVKAQDGTIKTHYLTLTRYSNDNTLLSISADGVDEDNITQTSENTYQMVVSNELTKLNLTAVTSNKVAKVKIGDNEYEVNTTTKEIAIPDDTNTVIITVQAENGDEKEYTLTIIKKYVLTLESITVDEENAIVEENGEYIAWIDPTTTVAQVIVTPTSSKVNVKVGSDISGTGTTSFTSQTPNEENTVKIVVSSPIEQDQVEYTLKIMKKSENTELEYVKVDGNVGTLEEDEITYTVKVPDKTGKYSMEVKTENRYAWVKIEDNEYSLETDTYEVDLTGVTTKTVTVTVKSQTGEEKTYKVNIEKVSEDATIKIVKVNNVEITTDENGNYIAFVDDTLASVPLYIETTAEKAQIKLDDGNQNVHTVTENVTMDKDQVNMLVTVTAENGTTKTCTVTIQKKSSDAEILSVKVDEKDAIQVDETTYYVTAKPGATEVKINVKSANPYAEVQINGSAKEVGENTIKYTLPIDTKIANVPIVITSQNGKVVNTYTLQIEQVSNDTRLETVQVDGENATYDEDNDVYRIIIDDSKDEAEVYVKTVNSEASVKIESGDLTKHQATEKVSTAAEENNITITVIAEDRTTVTKTLIIKKLSKDASIIKLYVNGNEIEPAEDGTYTADVLESIKTSAVKVKTTNANASITINGILGTTLGESSENIDTSTGRKVVVPIKITAEDTSVVNETTLTINMVSDTKELEFVKVNGVEVTDYDEKTNTYKAFIPATSTSAKLDIKTVSPYAEINIDEQSATNIITYTAETLEDITYVYVTVIAEDDSTRTYTVVLQKESTVTLNIPLSQDVIVIPVTVTAQDNTEVKTYNITLIRASNSTGIKEILVNGEVVDLTTFEHIVKNVNSSSIKVTTENENAKVSIDDATPTINIANATVDTKLSTVRTITVTAEDGTTKEYSLTLIKKVTIEGIITDENIMNKHIAEVIVYQTADTRIENDPINPREVVSTVQTNEDGTYEILLEPGIYDVIFTKPGYLSHRITEIDITDGLGAVLDTVDMVGGDVAEDGEIEIDDLVDMNENVGETITEDNTKEKSIYDLNGDGIIDMLDRKILKRNYGKIAEEVRWVRPRKRREEDIGDEDTNISDNTDISYIKSSDGTVLVARIEESYLICPISCDYKKSSNYGYRIHPITGEKKLHSGIDLVGKHHTEILTIADGEVTYAGVQNVYGNCIEIKHTINEKTLYSFYAHLSRIDVKVGQKVEAGDIIGLEGGAETDPNHGTSTGHHLHFEIRTATGSGHSIDPNDYIEF